MTVMLEKNSYGAVWENAGGNDTVPISLWHVGGMHSTMLLLQLTVCRVLDARVVGATSSEGF